MKIFLRSVKMNYGKLNEFVNSFVLNFDFQMMNVKSAGRPRIGQHEMFYIEPVNYYICGTTGSGKTQVVKKWLERLSEKNSVVLEYEGNSNVIRADFGINKPIGKTKVIVYEDFDPRKKGICYYGIPDFNEMLISTVFVSRDNVKETTYKVRRMIKEFNFKVIDMDQERKENETVEQTVERVVNGMECPYFGLFTKKVMCELLEKEEKRPKAPNCDN